MKTNGHATRIRFETICAPPAPVPTEAYRTRRAVAIAYPGPVGTEVKVEIERQVGHDAVTLDLSAAWFEGDQLRQWDGYLQEVPVRALRGLAAALQRALAEVERGRRAAARRRPPQRGCRQAPNGAAA